MKSLNDKRVLICDNDIDLCNLLEKILGGTGVNTTVTHNSYELFHSLESNIPHIIYLDINLDEGDNGLKILKDLKEDDRYRDIVVVMLSGIQNNPIVDKAIELGAEKYLQKPLNSKEIVMSLRQASKAVNLSKKSLEIYEKATLEIDLEISGVDEVNVYLTSEWKFSKDQMLEIDSPFIDHVGANYCKFNVSENSRKNIEGLYQTPCKIIGSNEDILKNIRSLK